MNSCFGSFLVFDKFHFGSRHQCFVIALLLLFFCVDSTKTLNHRTNRGRVINRSRFLSDKIPKLYFLGKFNQHLNNEVSALRLVLVAHKGLLPSIRPGYETNGT